MLFAAYIAAEQEVIAIIIIFSIVTLLMYTNTR